MLVKASFSNTEQATFDVKFQKRTLRAAEKLGDLIWKKGLQKNGSILDGIAGCGYAFHCLFRYYFEMSKIDPEDMSVSYCKSKSQKWFTRAWQFARSLLDRDI